MEPIFTLFFQSIKPKKIVMIILLILSVFFIFHTSVWFLFTKNILDTPDGLRIGDLARLSYQDISIHLRSKLSVNLAGQHIEGESYNDEKVDILTVGDSFSNAGAGGVNPYYQDYLTTMYHQVVLNISPSKTDTNYIETIMSMYNNGLLDKMQPKMIILSSVERSVLKTLSKDIHWDYNITQEQSLKNFKQSVFGVHKQNNISIINNGNYSYILNPIFYKLSKKPIERSGVYNVDLNETLFTVKANKTLIFHKNDIDSLPYNTQQNVKKLNRNLNKLAFILKMKNIQLAFMPAVDKYNLYSPYIINNTFPQSTFFELLRPLHKDYYFIDTKAILSPLLPHVKDLYYADDTHWHYSAAEEIIKQTPFPLMTSSTAPLKQQIQ